MPCDCSYMKPNDLERYRKAVAIGFVVESLLAGNRPNESDVVDAMHCYGMDGESDPIVRLCDVLRQRSVDFGTTKNDEAMRMATSVCEVGRTIHEAWIAHESNDRRRTFEERNKR